MFDQPSYQAHSSAPLPFPADLERVVVVAAIWVIVWRSPPARGAIYAEETRSGCHTALGRERAAAVGICAYRSRAHSDARAYPRLAVQQRVHDNSGA